MCSRAENRSSVGLHPPLPHPRLHDQIAGALMTSYRLDVSPRAPPPRNTRMNHAPAKMRPETVERLPAFGGHRAGHGRESAPERALMRLEPPRRVVTRQGRLERRTIEKRRPADRQTRGMQRIPNALGAPHPDARIMKRLLEPGQELRRQQLHVVIEAEHDVRRWRDERRTDRNRAAGHFQRRGVIRGATWGGLEMHFNRWGEPVCESLAGRIGGPDP